MKKDGRTPRQRRRIVWTSIGLALVALAIYVGFILFTAAQPPA